MDSEANARAQRFRSRIRRRLRPERSDSEGASGPPGLVAAHGNALREAATAARGAAVAGEALPVAAEAAQSRF